MWQNLLFIAGGLALLFFGGEALVRGATRLARNLGVPPLVVGLTVVAFGTSAPELTVSVMSALNGKPDIALGNVVGSNIFNVLFILGISALILPLVVAQKLIRIDVPIMIAVTALVALLGANGMLGRAEGCLLLAGLVAFTVFTVYAGRREKDATVRAEYDEEYGLLRARSFRRLALSAALVAGGLALLVVGSRLLLTGSVALARAAGLSELIIGLTIVAAGTSLPEVATSVLAAIRGERDIAVGNVVGSNIFNLLGVLGAACVVAPAGIAVSPAALRFDIPVAIATAAACLPIFFTGRRIARWEGGVLLAYYAAYTAFLILDARDHDTLPALSAFMLGFVVPITVLTLAIGVVRAARSKR